MPWTPALIIAAISAAASAGTGIYSAVSSSNAAGDARDAAAKQAADQQAQFMKQAQEKAAQDQTIAKSAISRQLPDLTAQLGGSVAPDYLAQVAASSTGNADQMNIARQLASHFGMPFGASSPFGLDAQALVAGQMSGGNVGQTPSPYGEQNGLTYGSPV